MGTHKSSGAQSDEEDLLIADEEEIAEQEASNGLLQFDEVERLIALHAPSKQLEFTPALVQELNRLALQGIRHSAGHL